MTTYHVTATRHGKSWLLECDELPTIISHANRLDQAADTIREAIAFVADVPEDSFTIELNPVLPEVYSLAEARARIARETALAANSEAARESRIAARALADEGWTVRDIGTVMGVSHQRAAQLLAA